MGLFITLAIIYTVVLLIWTKVNSSATKENNREWERFRKERRRIENENRAVTGMTVKTRSGEVLKFDDARHYSEYDSYEIRDSNKSIIAEFPKREVEAIIVHRIDADGN